jgi:hypothetical protein
MSAFAAQGPAKRVIDPQVYRSLQYSFPYPDEHVGSVSGTADRTVPRQSLGTAVPSASPGTAIGDTWYDYQHNGSMGRMIETNFGTAAVVHNSWMYLPSRDIKQDRAPVYANYDLTNSILGAPVIATPTGNYGGYVGIATTGDNRAILGGHNHTGTDTLYSPQFWWDYGEAYGYLGFTDRLPRTVQNYGSANDPNNEVIWPKFRYVEGPTDTVLHVIAQVSEANAGDPQAIYYFRRVGSDATPGATWSYPPYIIDTIYDLSQDIAATSDGKVALTWTANLPCTAADPDTASGYECRTYVQYDNDVYYQISTDYGVNWGPKHNLTNYIQTEGTDSYRPYTDLSALYDSNGDLHIVWAARFWPANSQISGQGQPGLYRGRIFHWSENQPYIRTAHSADWDQTTCSPGAWNLNAGKMSVSECNGRLYILFVQINDIPAGVEDDCAVESNPGFPTGSGNGDLYVTVSEDGGLTWDKARNITNSRTPGCDSALGTGGPCDNDNWPSMARFGTNYALAAGDNATEVVVPAGGTDNGWYLDVQYINDHSAGGIVQDEGTWQDADVRWVRLACVAAITAPNPVFSPTQIAFPTWVKPGESFNRTVTIENLGNAAYTYSVNQFETTGNAGWLSTGGFSGSVPFGVSNIGTGTMTIDASSYSTGTIAKLTGGVVFNGNAGNPDTIHINVIVADTVVPPVLDTIATSCLSLAVLNNGEFGNQGEGKVNMDFYNAGDCDTTATVYVYDGSPVVTWIDGVDTIGNWSVFGNNYVSPVGFFPQTEGSKSTVGVNQIYSTTFSTRDTSLLMTKTFYAPQGGASDCKYIIQELKVVSGDGASHSGLNIGEAIDWDIPADSGSRNGSGFNESAGLIYQFGGEYHQDDTGQNIACQDNDLRYGGMKFLGMYKKTADWTDLGAPSGAYTADNPTFVYGNDQGFKVGELYTEMLNTGFSAYSSSAPESLYTDLHMVMTYQTGYTVNPGETLLVYVALVTEENGGLSAFTTSANAAYDWYCANVITDPPGCGCCKQRGDVDNSGGLPNVADLTYLVRFLFQGGPEPPCIEQGDVDGSGGMPNVADLTYLVRFLFQGGPEPPAC